MENIFDNPVFFRKVIQKVMGIYVFSSQTILKKGLRVF